MKNEPDFRYKGKNADLSGISGIAKTPSMMDDSYFREINEINPISRAMQCFFAAEGSSSINYCRVSAFSFGTHDVTCLLGLYEVTAAGRIRFVTAVCITGSFSRR